MCYCGFVFFFFALQSKTTCAKLYRIYSPKQQHIVWKAKRTMHSRCSFIGPNMCKVKLINVMFTLSVFPSLTVEGSIRPVRALNFGSRCFGHGTNLNSWGVDQTKLMSCGM